MAVHLRVGALVLFVALLWIFAEEYASLAPWFGARRRFVGAAVALAVAALAWVIRSDLGVIVLVLEGTIAGIILLGKAASRLARKEVRLGKWALVLAAISAGIGIWGAVAIQPVVFLITFLPTLLFVAIYLDEWVMKRPRKVRSVHIPGVVIAVPRLDAAAPSDRARVSGELLRIAMRSAHAESDAAMTELMANAHLVPKEAGGEVADTLLRIFDGTIVGRREAKMRLTVPLWGVVPADRRGGVIEAILKRVEPGEPGTGGDAFAILVRLGDDVAQSIWMGLGAAFLERGVRHDRYGASDISVAALCRIVERAGAPFAREAWDRQLRDLRAGLERGERGRTEARTANAVLFALDELQDRDVEWDRNAAVLDLLSGLPPEPAARGLDFLAHRGGAIPDSERLKLLALHARIANGRAELPEGVQRAAIWALTALVRRDPTELFAEGADGLIEHTRSEQVEGVAAQALAMLAPLLDARRREKAALRLVELMASRDADTRAEVVSQLPSWARRAGPEARARALDVLLGACADRDLRVRRTVARHLQSPLWVGEEEQRTRAQTATMVADPDAEVRTMCAVAIGTHPERFGADVRRRALTELLAALREGGPGFHADEDAALHGLTRAEGPEGRDLVGAELERFLGSFGRSRRAAADRVLRRVYGLLPAARQAAIVTAFVDLIDGRSKSARLLGMNAIGNLRGSLPEAQRAHVLHRLTVLAYVCDDRTALAAGAAWNRVLHKGRE